MHVTIELEYTTHYSENSQILEKINSKKEIYLFCIYNNQIYYA